MTTALLGVDDSAGPPTLQRTQVLVAGGGPVGLATAIELGSRGIDCVVVEPRVEVSHARPRCKTVNVRTMEHLRRWGLAQRLRSVAPLPTSWSHDIVFCTSLTGHELSRFHGVLGLGFDGDRFPELGQQAPQFVLEELLRESVAALPTCRLATGYRVTTVEQDDASVMVRVHDQDGKVAVVSADYVVGCDGPRSVVRQQIGAAYVGEERALRPNFGMVFTAPGLAERVGHGRAVQYWIINDSAPALMGPLDLDDTWWIIAFGVSEEAGRRDPHGLIDGAVGAAIDAEIVSTDPWTARMQLVDTLRAGRVFLAGDAAHLTPPFGGHGLNTGIGDAVDLGWKLAAVLQGWGGDRLLDSYQAERRPIHARVIAEATRNMAVLAPELMSPSLDADGPVGDNARHLADQRIQTSKHAEFFALDLVLGVTIEDSPVVLGADAPGTLARAGHRLPHAWLATDVSLFDQLGAGLTLLLLATDDAADIKREAAAQAVPLTVLDLSQTDLRARYGMDAVLVRPDQYIAWCGSLAEVDPAELFLRVRGASDVARSVDRDPAVRLDT